MWRNQTNQQGENDETNPKNIHPGGKNEIVAKIKSFTGTVYQALQEVGVPASTYYRWNRLDRRRHGEPSGKTTTPQRLYRLSQTLAHEKEVQEVLSVSPCTRRAARAHKLAAIAKLYECGKYSVHALCEALGIARGTFYNYLKRGKVRTGEAWYMRRREELKRAVELVFHEYEQRFGSQKIADVLRAHGIVTTRQYVLGIMRELGLTSIRQNAKATYRQLNARRVNIVARQFHVAAPNAVWVGDVTCFRVKGRTHYICIVIDLYSRMVVSHRVGTSNSTRLTKSTLAAALECRQVSEGLVFHSDQGANYTSRAYAKFLRERGVRQSFSATARPHDNAVAESFFRNLKTEELYRRNYRSFREFKIGVSDYVRFYNEKRPHDANNGRTPLEKDRA